MKNGIYGLAALDGAPLDPRDRAILFAGIDGAMQVAPDCALAARDANADAIHVARDGDRVAVLLGDLWEPEENARLLGLERDCGPAKVAAAAHDRFGVDAATRLAGEWLLLRWDGGARALSLLMSECARDDCYFAVSDERVALAPELTRLANLPWVDADFDAEVLIRTMGRFAIRAGLGERTILKGVMQLRPGTSVTIRAEGVANAVAAEPPPPLLSGIGFEDAMGEVERLLRRVMRRRLQGVGDAAFLLSGGLDSSLLAWLAADLAGSGQRLHFLSSAAPDGSGIADETGWAALVADHLGVPLTRVAPPADADVYAPLPRLFAAWEAPIASPRHYLYRAFEDEAVARGAKVIFDGSFGELSISNHGFDLDSPRQRMRGLARAAREGIRQWARGRSAALAGQFHAQLAPDLLADMARDFTPPVEPHRTLRANEAFGFEPGGGKAARQSTRSSDPRTRYELPLRDPRLLRLVAGFPAVFTVHDGASRAMIRALLRNRLPDRIAHRQCKMAFSPSFQPMLRQQAADARERIAAQAAAGAADWLDLAWLDRALERAARGARLTPGQAFRAQGTAIAAEFFRWWRDRGAAPPST